MGIYDSLNDMQREAVYHTEGPLLILAGAGSGKTRVLTHRIAYLIQEKGIEPWNIMAITFTNKAAKEMRERVDQIVTFGSESIWVSTFHSSCVKILRRFIEHIGYDSNFTIYDTDDQRVLMRNILKEMDLDTKQFRDRAILSTISSAKNELIDANEFLLNAGGDWREKKIGEIYKEYQSQLHKNNALDFDDLIFRTVELLRSNKEVLNYYQEKFKHIMVDEYQDTNTAQFQLISLLAGKYKNLCVVGDDDQSIYKFRGANIRNILDFEQEYTGTRVIKLEQNYRSTANILNAANVVIKNNKGRKEKALWTTNEDGTPVQFKQYENAYEEALEIIREINKSEISFDKTAVLYRTNAQSRLIEEQCVQNSIPYRLIGGVNFYQRKEIKDMVCYLKTIGNGRDDIAVKRVINVPKRGIGATSITKVTAFAIEQNISFYEGCKRAKEITTLGKASEKILKFVQFIEEMRYHLANGKTVDDVIQYILTGTDYEAEILAEGKDEAANRLDNINELKNKAIAYYTHNDISDIHGFLEEIALVAEVDNLDESESRITLMTLHSAKGLEFPQVFLTGMEEGLFPGSRVIYGDDPSELEEERRLCYVGITRAMNRLIMTAAKSRMTNGEIHHSKVSRFIDEIPQELLSENRLHPRSVTSNEPTKGKSSSIHSFGKSVEQPVSFGKAFSIEKSSNLGYEVGNRVSHIKFGTGVVEAIEEGKKDFEVSVNFDSFGIKKMFASFAKLKLVEKI